MNYETYDELLKAVREFRLEHKDLTPGELDKLIMRRFRIGRSVLREIDGVSDLLTFGRNNPTTDPNSHEICW